MRYVWLLSEEMLESGQDASGEFAQRGYLVDEAKEKRAFKMAYLDFTEQREDDETQLFFEELNEFKVLQFIRSGRIAITRSPIERLSEFLRERDKMLSIDEV
jgi:hypothetical protein